MQAVAAFNGNAVVPYQPAAITTMPIATHDDTIRLDDITASLEISSIRRNR